MLLLLLSPAKSPQKQSWGTEAGSKRTQFRCTRNNEQTHHRKTLKATKRKRTLPLIQCTESQTQSYAINSAQHRPAATQPRGRMAKAAVEKKNPFDEDEKKMHTLLPKRTPCLTHSLPCGAANVQSLCTWELGAAPTIELPPAVVQRVPVASCREAKLSCCSSGVLSTLTDTSAAAGSPRGLPNLQGVSGEQTARPERRHGEANSVSTP